MPSRTVMIAGGWVMVGICLAAAVWFALVGKWSYVVIDLVAAALNGAALAANYRGNVSS